MIGIAAGNGIVSAWSGKADRQFVCKIRKNDLKCKEDATHGEKNVWRGEKWKKEVEKDTKESMIKEKDKHSRNKRGENIDRKDGSPKESQSQMDRTGTCDSSTVKRDDLDWWKQFGRAKRPESGTAAAPRGKDCRGRGAKQRTR